MLNNESYELKRVTEEKLHTITRLDNDARLIDKHEIIQTARDINLLEPFAKAYLGLFLEIDSTFTPEERIRFIASEPLSDAVMQGLSVVLHNLNDLPAISDIGKKMVSGERLEIGYVVLVAMDLFVKKFPEPEQAFQQIPSDVLSAALCFHYANSSLFKNTWVNALIHYQHDLVTSTLQMFWLPQMDKGVRYLPGLKELLKTGEGQQLVGDIILPILSGWTGYKKKSLNVLLAIALRYANSDKLLPIIEETLATNKMLNPRMRIVWLTSAFIIRPNDYWQEMVDYTYRSKEKLLPLLDFTIALLDEIELDVHVLTKIIRLVAPKFPPHIDDFGELAANPQKTLRLFYELANREELLIDELKWLRSARVMKIVSPVLDEVERLNKIKNQNTPFPEFPSFMKNLLNNGHLKEKRSRFKNKL